MYIRNKYFGISIENPLKTWWKARKFFKFPKWKVKLHYVYPYEGYPYASYKVLGLILDINIRDLIWKDKWDSPRHEFNPLIYICLFRKFALTIYPYIYYYNEFGEKENGDMYYWEYLVDYVYYSHNLKGYSAWVGESKLYNQRRFGNAEDGSEDAISPMKYVVPTVAMSLNKRGIKQLKIEKNI